MIKLAIIETDVPLPDVSAKYGGYGDIFTTLLSEGGLVVGVDAAITKHDVIGKPTALPRLDDESERPDAILITGSRYSAYDDVPWINALVEFTSKAIALDIRTVGE